MYLEDQIIAICEVLCEKLYKILILTIILDGNTAINTYNISVSYNNFIRVLNRM